jgi:DNA-directed RNA polymerase specialized sigma24 family protein
MDQEQFEQQIEQHTPALVDYARRAAGDSAEDAVNAAVTDLLECRGWERCAPGDDLFRFLKACVRYRILRVVKARKRDRSPLKAGSWRRQDCVGLYPDDAWDTEAQSAAERDVQLPGAGVLPEARLRALCRA